MVRAELENRFTYHEPGELQIKAFKAIREQALDLAETIASLTPESREQSLAITKLEEVVMWANAAIARNG
jgi:hypothetical protein